MYCTIFVDRIVFFFSFVRFVHTFLDDCSSKKESCYVVKTRNSEDRVVNEVTSSSSFETQSLGLMMRKGTMKEFGDDSDSDGTTCPQRMIGQ